MESEGEIEYLVVVARNMEGQRRTEAELESSEAKMRSIFEHANDLIYTVNQNFEIETANGKALEVIGQEIEGKRIQDSLLQENAATVMRMIRAVFEKGESLSEVIQITQGRSNGHYYDCNISLLTDGEGNDLAMVIARDITESKNLERHVLDALIEGQENERKRVARELHDGLGQLFTAINLNVQLCKNYCVSDNLEKAGNTLNELETLAKTAIREVKGISKDLMPDVLWYHGLQPAIQDAITHLNVEETEITFDVTDADGRYSENTELTIFRCFQELLNNAIKYAKAKTINVQLLDHGDALLFVIEDDGIGFDSKAFPAGHGINNSRTRTLALEGVFSIDSTLGKGTLVSVEVPAKKQI